MSITITPVRSGTKFGAEVIGANLFDGISDGDFSVISKALDDYAVVMLRGQLRNGRPIGPDEQLRFARQFGPLDDAYIPQSATRSGAIANPNFGEVSNVDSDGKLWSEDDKRRWFLMANYLWHSDTSYKQIPTRVTLLSAHEVPPVDGLTEFADMRAAWRDLPQELKDRLLPLTAEHSVFHSRGLTGFSDFSDEDRAAAPPAIQPLVRRNPNTGELSLYLSAHASHIVGWPIEDGKELLEELTERATQPKYVYSHEWRVGDVVIWDNSTTLHRAMPFDEFNHRRVLKRTSVNEIAPVLNGISA